MRARSMAMVLGIGLGWACGVSAYQCSDDAQCVYGGAQGVCQANQYCTFPDDECPSGQRYGEAVGDGLAGMCLDVDAGTSDASTSAGSGSGDGIDRTTTTTTTTASTGDVTGVVSDTAPEDTGGHDTGPLDTGPLDTGPGGSSDTGPPGPPPYDDCSFCSDRTQRCIDLGVDGEVCVPHCMDDADCPPADGSAIDPTCEGGLVMEPVCVLPCQDDFDCPRGMSCGDNGIEIFGFPVCAWD